MSKPAMQLADTPAQTKRGNCSAAMAYRAKYRVKEGPAKQYVAIQWLGVHKKNRGGAYPSGLRCRALGLGSLARGFSKEELNHAGVVVQERPLSEVAAQRAFMNDGANTYQSMSEYNIGKSKADEMLETCFTEGMSEVRFGTLSHSHMMLVLRAWLTKAKWEIPEDKVMKLIFCDDEGRLSLAAVADHPNAVELHEALREGILVEVLSYKMDIEQPDAASIISQALNEAQELALSTTEQTAVSVLQGLAITEMSKDVGQRVAFQTIKDLARAHLGSAVDEVDFMELYDWILSMGVGKNIFIDEFLEFTSTFVDSKLRRLRFAAFAVSNRTPPQFPRSKLSQLYRAYRQKPQNGICANPPSLEQYHGAQLAALESLLHYFHTTCKAAMESLPPQSRRVFLASIDVQGCSGLLATRKGANETTQTKLNLIEYTTKPVHDMMKQDVVLPPPPQKERAWIAYPPSRPVEAKPAVAAAESLAAVAPQRLEFDPATGELLNAQVTFHTVEAAVVQKPVPWKIWGDNPKRPKCEKEGDIASAVAALQNRLAKTPVTDAPIDITLYEGKVRVIAERDMEKGELKLPALNYSCTLKTETTTLLAAKFVVATLRDAKDADDVADAAVAESAPSSGGKAKPEPAPKKASGPMKGRKRQIELEDTDVAPIHRSLDLWMTPDWKLPQETKGPEAEKQPWKFDGMERMYPFWAVRRITAALLKKDNANLKTGVLKANFNCELAEETFTNVTMGGGLTTITRTIKMPYMANSTKVNAGEELLFEVEPIAAKKTPAITWQHLAKAQAKGKANAIIIAKAPAPTKGTTPEQKPDASQPSAVAASPTV